MFLLRRMLAPGPCLIWIALLSLAGTGAVNAQTVQVSGLYSAEVPVAGANAGSRTKGFRKALEQVLIKVAGSGEVLEKPQAEPILEKASRYALRYSYEEKEEQPADENGEDADAGGLYLTAEFDGAALEQAMHAAGLPVWGANRPTTLVWLGVQSGGERFIVSEDGDSDVRKRLHRAADERGVPLILPLMDLEDRRRVEYADIRGGFTENLLDAAGRYDAAVVMIGALQELRSGEWTAKWSVHREGSASDWNERGTSLTGALRSGVHGLADILAEQYAFSSVPGGMDDEYVIAVDRLATLDDYAGVLNLLNRFVFVRRAMPVHVEADRMMFRVRMSGRLSELERALTLSNRLQPARPGDAGDRAVEPARSNGTAIGADQDEQADLYYTVRR